MTNGYLNTKKIYNINQEDKKKLLSKCGKALIELAIYYDHEINSIQKSSLARKYNYSETFIIDTINKAKNRLISKNIKLLRGYVVNLTVEDLLSLYDLANVDELNITVNTLNGLKTAYYRGYTYEELLRLSPLNRNEIKKFFRNQRLYGDIPKEEVEQIKLMVYYHEIPDSYRKKYSSLVNNLGSAYKRYRTILEKSRENGGF